MQVAQISIRDLLEPKDLLTGSTVRDYNVVPGLRGFGPTSYTVLHFRKIIGANRFQTPSDMSGAVWSDVLEESGNFSFALVGIRVRYLEHKTIQSQRTLRPVLLTSASLGMQLRK